jgi:hypothetical protein
MTAELTVGVKAAPSLGSWRAWLRPAGPAGQLTVRLPFGVTVWLDRAEPQLILEVAADGPVASPEAAALLRVLYGSAAAELAVAEGCGDARYAPDGRPAGHAVQALLAALGAAAELPSIAVIDLARHSRRLAAEIRSDDPVLANLLQRVATECAARGVAALRMLPARAELGLAPTDLAVLDEAVGVVRDLVGAELSLGPIADQPPANPELEAAQSRTNLPDLELARALWGGDSAGALRGGERMLGTGSWLVDLAGCILPVAVSELVIVEDEPGSYRLDGQLAYFQSGDDGNLTPLPAVPPEAAPAIWARVVRTGDGAVLYAAQCLLEEGHLSASVQVKPEYRYREQFWVELTTDVDEPVRTPFQRRADLARRQGAIAAFRQREATVAEQWTAVGDLWTHCARLWGNAGDFDRQALATVHAARAYAGGDQPDVAARVAKQATTLAGRLDARWLAPDPARRASADPLAIGAMISLSRLGPPVTAWVVSQLEQTIAGAVPPLLDGYLTALLDLTPRTADPAYGRLRRLRARARIAVAHYASGYPDTLPVASALLAPASADWPYLDQLGRDRFAAVNRQLLGAGEDVATS